MSGCLRLGQEVEEQSTAVAVPDALHLGVLGDPDAYPGRLGSQPVFSRCLKADERLVLRGKVRVFGLRGIYWVLNKLEDGRTACILNLESEFGCPDGDTEKTRTVVTDGGAEEFVHWVSSLPLWKRGYEDTC